MTTLQKASDHLWWTELACRGTGACYPVDWRTDPTRAVALARAFEDVRAECSAAVGHDCPITVLEGYRTTAYQERLRAIPRLKAARHSQHCEGRAVDLACPRELTFAEFEACVRRACARATSPIRYVELRPAMHYIHVDVRPRREVFIETVA